MPFPTTVAKINRRLTNPLLSRFAGRLPSLAIVEHRGRRSGRIHRTPVMAFPSNDRFVIALTYGPKTDWVRNIMAEGRCVLEYQRKRIPLTSPKLFHAELGTVKLPIWVRPILTLVRVTEYLQLQRDGDVPPVSE